MQVANSWLNIRNRVSVNSGCFAMAMFGIGCIISVTKSNAHHVKTVTDYSEIFMRTFPTKYARNFVPRKDKKLPRSISPCLNVFWYLGINDIARYNEIARACITRVIWLVRVACILCTRFSRSCFFQRSNMHLSCFKCENYE